MYPPKGATRWFGAFGAAVLCQQKSGHNIVVSGVRLMYGADRPVSGKVLIRIVTPAFSRRVADKRGLLPDYGSVGLSSSGLVRAGKVVSGDDVDLKVGVSCSESTEDIVRLNTGRAIEHTLYDVIALLESDARGAVLKQVLIDYSDNGRPRTLRVPWESDMCGTSVVGDNCPRGAHQ